MFLPAIFSLHDNYKRVRINQQRSLNQFSTRVFLISTLHTSIYKFVNNKQQYLSIRFIADNLLISLAVFSYSAESSLKLVSLNTNYFSIDARQFHLKCHVDHFDLRRYSIFHLNSNDDRH